jgi:hypothetical protein
MFAISMGIVDDVEKVTGPFHSREDAVLYLKEDDFYAQGGAERVEGVRFIHRQRPTYHARIHPFESPRGGLTRHASA